MTRLRKQNGRRDPWKVQYWGLGNEMDGPWQMGHRSAEDYGKFALEAAKLMKWTDPSSEADRRRFVQLRPGHRLDRLEPHGARVPEARTPITSRSTCTSATATNDFGDFMASSVELDQRTKITEGIIDAALSGQTRQPQDLYRLGRVERLVSRARQHAARPAHPRRALQPRRRAGGRDVPQLVRQPRAHREDRQHGATGERDRADLHQRARACSCRRSTIRWRCSPTTPKAKLSLYVDSPKYKTRRFDDVPYLDVSAAFDNGTARASTW